MRRAGGAARAIFCGGRVPANGRDDYSVGKDRDAESMMACGTKEIGGGRRWRSAETVENAGRTLFGRTVNLWDGTGRDGPHTAMVRPIDSPSDQIKFVL